MHAGTHTHKTFLKSKMPLVYKRHYDNEVGEELVGYVGFPSENFSFQIMMMLDLHAIHSFVLLLHYVFYFLFLWVLTRN